MSRPWLAIEDFEPDQEHKKKCRLAHSKYLSDNIHERTRCHIVRVVRECNSCVASASSFLGLSQKTIRKYLKFIPFEHLMKNPNLAEKFDWRSLTEKRWIKLLSKHPRLAEKLPKNFDCINYKLEFEFERIINKHPEIAKYFSNYLHKRPHAFVDLMIWHPELEYLCKDCSNFEGYYLMLLIKFFPKFLDISPKLRTLLPYYWHNLIVRWQIEGILEKMEAKPRNEWHFNFKVFYLRTHAEYETEFTEWDKIHEADWEDIVREQPEIAKRHEHEIDLERNNYAKNYY